MSSIRVLLLALLAVATACGTVLPLNESPSNRIIGGTVVQTKTFNHIASLQSYSQGYLCGGAIINQLHVLTAAHCGYGQSTQSLRMRVGSKRKYEYGVLHYVSQVKRHPQFNANNRLNDIAIVKTSTRIVYTEYVHSVPVATFNYGVANAVVAGWGRLNRYPESGLSESLMYLNTRSLLNSDCKSRYAHSPSQAANIRNSNICTLTSGKGVCDGDSGSPLTVNGELVGLVSWINRDCGGNVPDVYTRVSTYVAWISQNTRDY